MLPIAGQTAGSNGLKFFVNTHGGNRLKNRFFFNLKKIISFKFFFPRATPGPSACFIYIYIWRATSLKEKSYSTINFI